MPSFEIIERDIFEAMDALRDDGRRFDVLIADPPYCSGGNTPASVARSGVLKYLDTCALGDFRDNMTQRTFMNFTREWLAEAATLLKSPGYAFVFCDWRQIPAVSDALQFAGYYWRGVIPWNKKNARPNKGHITQMSEFVVWGTVDEKKSLKVCHHTFVYPSPPVADRIHPTQKAPEVIRDFLDVLPDTATDALELFSGSASGGVAAIQQRLNYVGVEKNHELAERSRKRLADYLAEQTCSDPPEAIVETSKDAENSTSYVESDADRKQDEQQKTENNGENND